MRATLRSGRPVLVSTYQPCSRCGMELAVDVPSTHFVFGRPACPGHGAGQARVRVLVARARRPARDGSPRWAESEWLPASGAERAEALASAAEAE